MIDNRIYNEDCLVGLRDIPDEYIDLTVTSPPYDNLRDYNGYSFDFENIAKEMYRVTKPGGVVVWIVNDMTIKGSETGTSFKQALFFKDIGFNLHDTMIWKKTGCQFPETVRYYPNFEYMFIFSKGKPKAVNLITDRENRSAGVLIHGTDRQRDGTTIPSTAVRNGISRKVKKYGVRYNVWEMPACQSNLERVGHPAQFPEKLAKDHILSWSNPGDIVLDPFMGSGTVAKMAMVNNRRYIGFEISREYCDIANKRLSDVMT